LFIEEIHGKHATKVLSMLANLRDKTHEVYEESCEIIKSIAELRKNYIKARAENWPEDQIAELMSNNVYRSLPNLLEEINNLKDEATKARYESKRSGAYFEWISRDLEQAIDMLDGLRNDTNWLGGDFDETSGKLKELETKFSDQYVYVGGFLQNHYAQH